MTSRTGCETAGILDVKFITISREIYMHESSPHRPMRCSFFVRGAPLSGACRRAAPALIPLADPTHADAVGEQRERELAGQPVRALHPRRQVFRLAERPFGETRRQPDHVFQRELAGEEVVQQVQPAALEGPAEEGVYG